MSKKTFFSLVALVLFTFAALGSASTQSSSSYGSSSSSSSRQSLSDIPKTDFPPTAKRCPSCLGAGCDNCNNMGYVYDK